MNLCSHTFSVIAKCYFSVGHTAEDIQLSFMDNRSIEVDSQAHVVDFTLTKHIKYNCTQVYKTGKQIVV